MSSKIKGEKNKTFVFYVYNLYVIKIKQTLN